MFPTFSRVLRTGTLNIARFVGADARSGDAASARSRRGTKRPFSPNVCVPSVLLVPRVLLLISPASHRLLGSRKGPSGLMRMQHPLTHPDKKQDT